MSIPFGQDETVKIDQAHADLLYGLVVASKPTSILELGIGGGQATDAMLKGVDYNQLTCQYTLVDNWMDFNYTIPAEVAEKYSDRVQIITSNEKDFVFSCTEQFDLIMSDADHHQADQWFEYVVDTLLKDNGILCYHDVTLVDQFPNLQNILHRCQELNLRYKLFNKDSLPTEMCYRGFLVIFK